MFEIQNKVAVVTGGGGVLGSNISKGLLQAGAKVIILDIREEVLE
jgi:NAD(P)-dependent dehydrogenase (short-subunit alcohol dehydrogenase family)